MCAFLIFSSQSRRRRVYTTKERVHNANGCPTFSHSRPTLRNVHASTDPSIGYASGTYANAYAGTYAILHDAQFARCRRAGGPIATTLGMVPGRICCRQVCFHSREKDVDCLFNQQGSMVHKLRVVFGGVVNELHIPAVRFINHLLHSLHLLPQLGHFCLQLLLLLLHLLNLLS